MRRPFFRLSDLVLIRSIFLLSFRSRSAYYCEKNRSQKIFPTVKILISKKTVSTCNSGDSDYNESRDRTGRVQERIKPIPGKRYGTKKKRNGRFSSSCTWGTRLGISVACHSVASKIESRLGPLRNKPRKYDKEQTQEIVLVVVGAVDHEGKQNHKTLPWCPAVFLVKNSHQKLCSPGIHTSNKNRIEIKRANF